MRQSTMIIFLIISVIQTIWAVILLKQDSLSTSHWFIFALHICSLLIIVTAYLSASKKSILNFFKKRKKQELILFLMLTIISLSVNFWALKSYPFVSLGDEVRDAGLDAMRIATGTNRNLFGYGNYVAYGLIIPTVSSFFFRIFGNSALTYRIPSGLIASFDILLIYLLLRGLTNKTAAFLGAISLLGFPLHLYFGRTEFVVILSSFFTSAILLAVYILFEKRRLIDIILTATLLGFTAQFHAAVRVVALIGFMSVLLFILLTNLSKRQKIRQKIKYTGFSLLLLIIFSLIGFGPQIVATNKDVFFHISSFSFKNNLDKKSLPSWLELKELEGKYKKSFMVWFYEPTTFFYMDRKPLLSSLTAAIWLLGIGYAIFIAKKPFLIFPLFLVIAIPFFNSAITDNLNADHRLIVLLPVAAFFISYGIFYLYKVFNNNKIRNLIFVSFAFYLFLNIVSYYKNQPANIGRDINQYVDMHTVYFLQKMFPKSGILISDSRKNKVCLLGSPANYNNFRLMHYKEQFD